MDLYAKLKEVEHVYPNAVATFTATTPNDSLFSEQWAHNVNHLQSQYGWDIETGDSTIVIAIHDTGVDWEHPDLEDNIWVNPGEDLDGDGVVGDTDDLNGVDDDGNGYEDDIIGWDFWDGDWDPQHTAGADTCHGTKVAGIAAAVTNNDSGVAGVVWNCKIMPVRVGRGYSFAIIPTVAEGIRYARMNGADVLNMSWRYYGDYSHIRTQIDSAYSDGLVLVAAAGNEDTSAVVYPAGYDSVLAVAAVDSNDVKRSNSNYGSWVTVSAPGEGCWTTKYVNGAANPHQYHLGVATSIATTHVSGLAALLLSYDPSLTNSEVRDIIEKSADDIDSKNPSYVGLLGSGRINVFKALFRAKGYGNIAADVTWYNDIPLTGDVTVNNGVTLTIQPGVTVEFDTTDVSLGGRDSTLCELIVEGKLIAQGTSTDSIAFRSNSNTSNRGEWHGIVFESMASSASQISYSRIRNAVYGIYSDDADPHIERNTISDCTIGIKGVKMGLIGSITQNRIKNGITGVSLYDSNVPVQYNNLSSNVRSAYFFNTTSRVRYDTLSANENSGIALMSNSDATFGDDQVVGNGLWGLRLWHKSDPVLRFGGKHNNIRENGGSGRPEIHCSDNSQPRLGTSPSSGWGYNDIVPEPGGKAIYIADPDTAITVIDAIGNWWGTSDPDSTVLFYPSWAVNFRPYLTESQFKPALSSEQDAEQQVALGMDLEEQGAYGEAFDVYRGVLLDYPQTSSARTALGGLHRSYRGVEGRWGGV